MKILNFLKGLFIRLTGLLLAVLGFAICVLLWACGIAFFLFACVLFLLTGNRIIRFSKYFFAHSTVLPYYGCAIIVENEWINPREFVIHELGMEKKDQVDYE